jgi:hypothetical protein
MSTGTVGTLLQFVWPMLVSAVAWAIAVWALKQPDTHSEIVSRLTRPTKPPRPETAHRTAGIPCNE